MQGTDDVERALGDLPGALLRGSALTRAGRTTEALAELVTLRTSGDLVAGSVARALQLAATMDCRLARGDLGEALALGDELAPYRDRSGAAAALAHHAHGELSAALSEPESAGRHIARAGRLLQGHPLGPDLVPWRVGAARVFASRAPRYP